MFLEIQDYSKLWCDLREQISLVKTGDKITPGQGSFGHITGGQFAVLPINTYLCCVLIEESFFFAHKDTMLDIMGTCILKCFLLICTRPCSRRIQWVPNLVRVVLSFWRDHKSGGGGTPSYSQLCHRSKISSGDFASWGKPRRDGIAKGLSIYLFSYEGVFDAFFFHPVRPSWDENPTRMPSWRVYWVVLMAIPPPLTCEIPSVIKIYFCCLVLVTSSCNQIMWTPSSVSNARLIFVHPTLLSTIEKKKLQISRLGHSRNPRQSRDKRAWHFKVKLQKRKWVWVHEERQKVFLLQVFLSTFEFYSID